MIVLKTPRELGWMRQAGRISALALRAAGDFKIIVGGAVLTQDYADSIGADCYAPNAVSAVNYANSLQ